MEEKRQRRTKKKARMSEALDRPQVSGVLLEFMMLWKCVVVHQMGFDLMQWLRNHKNTVYDWELHFVGVLFWFILMLKSTLWVYYFGSF
jgi:hypothetical protein